MSTHLTAVTVSVSEPLKYAGWCETCKRELGPSVDDEVSAREQIAAHEKEVADGKFDADHPQYAD